MFPKNIEVANLVLKSGTKQSNRKSVFTFTSPANSKCKISWQYWLIRTIGKVFIAAWLNGCGVELMGQDGVGGIKFPYPGGHDSLFSIFINDVLNLELVSAILKNKILVYMLVQK